MKLNSNTLTLASATAVFLKQKISTKLAGIEDHKDHVTVCNTLSTIRSDRTMHHAFFSNNNNNQHYNGDGDVNDKEDNDDTDCKDSRSDSRTETSAKRTTVKRLQLVWTLQLHKRFVDVVAHLGIKNAVPKTIMQLMNVEGTTLNKMLIMIENGYQGRCLVSTPTYEFFIDINTRLQRKSLASYKDKSFPKYEPLKCKASHDHERLNSLCWEPQHPFCDCSGRVRMYALFLEEKLECFRILRYDIEAERLTKPSQTNEGCSSLICQNMMQ
ncbi:Transcription factor BOA [Glycine soja]